MKLYCQQIMNQLLDSSIDYAKVQKFTTDAKYDDKDIKATIAAVDFIFSSAGKYSVDGDSLSNELQQLGLPKELATSLCKVYSDKKEQLQLSLKEKSMRVAKLTAVDWRVDYVLGSSFLDENNGVEINLKITKECESNREEQISFTASEGKFQMLTSELRDVYKMMENLS